MVILDLRLSRHIAVNALKMALGQRRPGIDLIHHSDRGVQYLSDDFQDLLKKHGITCSMSDKGSCYDNAAVEHLPLLVRNATRPDRSLPAPFGPLSTTDQWNQGRNRAHRI